MASRMRGNLQTVKVDRTFIADENDVLRDTDLAQAPGEGVVGIWAASTQSDHLVSVRIDGAALVTEQLVPNRGANAPISEEQEAPMASTTVARGAPIKVDVDIVTAGTTRIVAMWLGVK